MVSPTTPGLVARKPAQRSLLRAVGLPAEHGGWALLAEPAVLGLLVRPSLAGAVLAAAAVAAFLARSPLKLALVDHWRRRRLPRTLAAERLAFGELVLLSGLLALAATLAARSWWLPLAGAVPLFGAEMWFDMRSRGRRAVPELCGAVGIGSVSAAIARAGGAGWAVSLGLWALLAARSVSTVPVTRAQVQRARGRPTERGWLWAPQVAAVAAVAAAWWAGALPLAAVAGLAALSLWSYWSLYRPPRPAKVLGASQAVAGLALVLLTAGALRFGW